MFTSVKLISDNYYISLYKTFFTQKYCLLFISMGTTIDTKSTITLFDRANEQEPACRARMSAACRLLFIADESAQPMVVTMSKNT